MNIGLIGFGTIGSGVYSILSQQKELIKNRTGKDVTIKKIFARTKSKALDAGVDASLLVDSFDDILNDPEIDCVVELIGGYSPAKEYIIKSLQAGKRVVTANKAVLAKHGQEIIDAAAKDGIGLNFEAAVGGCVPVIRTLTSSYVSDRITSMFGIVNGTCNYILTRMEEGMSYEDALSKAQDLGFAEADPSFDVEGTDSAQKMVVLSRLAFNANLTDDVFTWGIDKLSRTDIQNADILGYKIKMLAIAKKNESGIEIRVHPTMIAKDHELATVRNELNAVYLVGEDTGTSMLYGKGAGQLPTATVVVGDILKGQAHEYSMNTLPVLPMDDVETRYYMRFGVLDIPNVLAQITEILGDKNISIKSVSQKEHGSEIVPIIMTTHQAKEQDLIAAVKAINSLEVVKEKAVVIRIEDLT